MRTNDEILAKIKEIKSRDFFGTIQSDLIGFLPFEHAKQFLKDGVTEDQWTPDENTREKIIKIITEYMEFAWDKANNCRGLSAGRTMDHMYAWLWLLEEDELALETRDYRLYGKPQLRLICEKFGVDWRPLHNGQIGNGEYEQEEGMP